LFSVGWVLSFEVNLMRKVFGNSEVIFVHAEGILMLVENVNVIFFKLIWDLQVASLHNTLSENFFIFYFLKFVMDVLATSWAGIGPSSDS